MTRLIEDYLREVESTLRVDDARKRQIIAELRSHLQEKIEHVEREEPTIPLADVERRVLGEMGSPRDLALAYEPDGTTVLRSGTGDTVLRVGAAVGRGVGKFLKWFAIVTAILLVIATGVAIWAFYEVKPYAEAFANEARPVYSFDQTCSGTPCNGQMPADTFFVANTTHSVRFTLWLSHARNVDTDLYVGNGTVHVLVRDPTNETRLDKTFNMTNASSLQTESTWAAATGNWTVSVDYTGFQGEIQLEGYARSDFANPKQ